MNIIDNIGILQVILMFIIALLVVWKQITLKDLKRRSFRKKERVSVNLDGSVTNSKNKLGNQKEITNHNIVSIVILLVYAFLCSTTIYQYISSKNINNFEGIEIVEIILIIGSITGFIFLLIIGIFIAYVIAIFLIKKIESFEFNKGQGNELLGASSFEMRESKDEHLTSNSLLKKKVHDLIAEDKTDFAIKILLKQKIDIEILNALRLNSSRFLELKKRNHLNLIPSSEYYMQKSKIENSILEIIKDLE